MRREDVLDLVGIDLQPAGGNDDVLLAIDDPEEAVGRHLGHVAGVEPGPAVIVTMQDLRRLVGPLPVAGHDLRPADAQHARLARLDDLRLGLEVDEPAVGIGQRQADAIAAPAGAERVAVRRRGRLGQAVSLDQPAAGQPLELAPGPRSGSAAAPLMQASIDRRSRRPDVTLGRRRSRHRASARRGRR